MYDVHAIKVLFVAEDKEQFFEELHDKGFVNAGPQEYHLQEYVVYEVPCHEGDSVSDLKRRCQKLFAGEWNLNGRTVDRDHVATGFELVANGLVLSYHLFLGTYGIKNNDMLYAVVSRHEV